MGVPANSAASERVFSNGGDIITKQRNKIGSSDTRYLLCLRDWGILSEIEDDDSDLDDGDEYIEESNCCRRLDNAKIRRSNDMLTVTEVTRE